MVLLVSGSPPAVQAASPILSLEQAIDGRPVDIPGVIFTTDRGGRWLYGDVRTRKYNAPYPASCADRPGGLATPRCNYAVDGNIFVWTGFLGREARIIFEGRSATYFRADVSSGTDLVMTAYGADDRPIVAAFLGTNQGTGNLSRMEVRAPSGVTISSIRIAGSANFWLMDNLESDAFTIEQAKPAQITATAHLAVNGTTITYTLVATNRGSGAARNALLMLPFDPSRLRLIDASFSRSEAWVSRVLSSALELQTGPLRSAGDTVTSTVRLEVLQPLAPGDTLGPPATVRWWSAGGSGVGRANLPVLSDTGLNSLAVLTQEGRFNLSSDLFLPNEPVSLWLNLPGGTVISLGTTRATNEGRVSYDLTSGSLVPGFYSAVARGVWSSVTTVGTFEVR